MAEVPKKSWLASMSPIKRTTLGIVIIALAIVLGVIYGPHYDVDNTTTGDTSSAPVIINGAAGEVNVNHSFLYQGVTITVTNVEQAQTFSDDGKSSYAHVKYIIRVNLHVQSPANQQTAIGIDYCTLSHLVLSNGSQLPCKLAQISPDVLPNQQQDGFIDFWISTPPLQLSQLAYTLNNYTVAFK